MIFKNWKVFRKIGRRFTLKWFTDQPSYRKVLCVTNCDKLLSFWAMNNVGYSVFNTRLNDLIDFWKRIFLIVILITLYRSSISRQKVHLDLHKLLRFTSCPAQIKFELCSGLLSAKPFLVSWNSETLACLLPTVVSHNLWVTCDRKNSNKISICDFQSLRLKLAGLSYSTCESQAVVKQISNSLSNRSTVQSFLFCENNNLIKFL